ncbi:hypothetical protein ABPG75_007629 [Micractinium tetrahymenae]
MQYTAPVAQQRRLAGPCAHAVPSPARAALPSAPRRSTLRCSAIKHDSPADEQQPTLRDRAAGLLTGLAASALAFNAGSAQAVETATAASSAAAGGAKPPMPDIPTSNRSTADLQAELERRNAAELSRFSGDLTSAQSSAIKGVEELQRRNTENLKQFVSELEASKAAAVRSVDELQKRVAAEHATMLQLQAELRTAKAMLDTSQKDVEKEKGLLVAAKEAAQAARKEAAEAAAAARTAELALRGQAGLETLKSPLGLAAASGWTLAAIVALAKQRSPADEIDWSKVEGKDEILAAMEQARQDGDALRRESDALKRDLTTMQNTVTQLTKQLEQERTQRDTLRETILLLEGEVSSMEQRMNSAKTEAAALKKKLDDVNVPTTTPKRPSLNEILTGQAAAAAKAQHAASNGSSLASSGSSPYSSAPSSSSFTSSRSSSNSASSASPYSSAGMGSGSAGSASSGSSAGAFSGSGSLNKYDVAAAAKALGSSGRAVRVKFTLQKELPFGQSLKLVGSHPALGAWDETRGLPMTWGDGHVWTGEVPLPIGTAVEFKAVKVVGGPDAYSEWEGGSNHVLLIPDSTTTSSLAVRVEWGAGTAVLDEAGRKKEEHGKVLATAVI